MHGSEPDVHGSSVETQDDARATYGAGPRRGLSAWTRVLARIMAAMAGAALLAAAIAPLFGSRPALAPLRSTVHSIERRVESSAAARTARAHGDRTLVSGPFTVYYPPGHGEEARLVLDAVRRYAPRVYADVGTALPANLTIIVERDDAAMNADLHIGGQAPVGAYWSGTLWVLAPSTWLDGGDGTDSWAPDSPAGRDFLLRGPIAHELAHAALDQRLGRQPETWFDEGVAQYEDARITGFLWREPANDFDQPLYTYEELARDFDRLPNVALAYREAYALMASLAKADGGQGVRDALALMQDGASADQAARAVLGPAYEAWRGGAPWRDGTRLPRSAP